MPAAVHCLISTTGLRVKGRTVKVPIFLPKVQEVHFRVMMTVPEVKGRTVQLLREQVLRIFPEYKVSALSPDWQLSMNCSGAGLPQAASLQT